MTSRALRIIYMGTPDFAVPTLQALIASQHEVVTVVTNPDRRSGRGKKVTASPVKQAALAAGIPVYQPAKMRKNAEAIAQLTDLAPDLIVVAAYGQILPLEILSIPPMGCLNVHASLLPAYRGAAPINWCIVRGESESGVTIMEMEQGLDTGAMVLKGTTSIPEDMTAEQLHDALAAQGAQLILPAIEGLLTGELTPEPQDHALASWAPMIKKEDGLIDWSKSARQVCDLVRGFNPWPGATTFHLHGDEATGPIKLHLAKPLELEHSAQPGELLEVSQDELVVACGQGAISCLLLQAPGKRALSARDFLNGYTLAPGERFGTL